MSASFPAPLGAPTELRDGERLFISEDRQLLYVEPIELQGDAVIQIDGALIEVD